MVDTIDYLLKCNYGKDRLIHNFHPFSRNIVVAKDSRPIQTLLEADSIHTHAHENSGP
jgi:hypothetical protein